ncbi:MAG: Molybdopterin-guanine dinucleotide biosynthesis adapter protein [Pelotomaculum sp. PtaU1.Bin035]|nr:MAG: Molybdopterin-guanine dinucleotide biosynthesis adapter protein [Pelotomaculum sp. PtaU1.Bin035]
MEMNVPVIGLAGYSGSGKTTFLEKLIAELKRRGYRVGVIKHTHHQVEFDQPGTDTWRHSRAGADVVALAAPNGVSLVRNFESEPGPEKVISMIDEVDVIIIEGYKRGKWPKIEVFRSGMTERPVIPAEELLAVVSDAPQSAGVPRFGLDDAVGTAGLIERVILKKL